MADVLLADDDEGVRAVMREVLEDDGYTIIEAADGREALAMATGHPLPLVVVLDLAMPELSGIEVLQSLLARDDGVDGKHAYILVTAARLQFSAEAEEAIRSLGAVLLPKPFDIDMLSAVVAEAARRVDAAP